jgi:hypothetical protein
VAELVFDDLFDALEFCLHLKSSCHTSGKFHPRLGVGWWHGGSEFLGKSFGNKGFYGYATGGRSGLDLMKECLNQVAGVPFSGIRVFNFMVSVSLSVNSTFWIRLRGVFDGRS